MRTPAEYRQEADEYVQRANAVIHPARRLRLLTLAQDCLKLAEQADTLEFPRPDSQEKRPN